MWFNGVSTNGTKWYQRYVDDLRGSPWTHPGMDLVHVRGASDMAVRVHLADDHTMFREGLESILASRAAGIEVVGRSSTGGEDALALIEEKKPDVVITQIDVDLKVAKEVLARIKQASPDSKIVVLTMLDNLRYLKALSKMGIDAYIDKSSSSGELLATVEALSRQPAGENAVVSMPRSLLERMDDGPAGALSEREMDIVVLAARGLSNHQIAEELHLAEATVKRHLANVYQKMGVGSRSEAVRTALQEQWIGLREITHAVLDGSSGGSSKGSGDRMGSA
jgi:DNA-binding NarL/FixJ family response regulator